MKSKVIYCIVVLAVVFGACSENLPEPVQVNDDDFQNMVRLNNPECEYTVHSDGLAEVVINGKKEYVTRFKLTDDYGNIIYAYCANMNAPCYEGARYQCASADDYFKNDEDTKIKAALTYMMNRYGYMETTNPHGFRQMVQCIIWTIIHGYEVTSVVNAEGEIIKEAIHYVYNNIDDLTKDYTASVTMEGENTATEDDLFVIYGPYQVSENALLTDADFHLTFEPNDAQVVFVNEAGGEITSVKPEEPFYLRIPNDFSGDLEYTATASTTEELWFVDDFNFFTDVREGDFQQLFQPVMNPEAWTYFYSCTGKLTITPADTEPDPDSDPDPETITLTKLNWNNGNGCGNGAGINSFKVGGITLKNNKNHVTPAQFDVLITKAPCKNGETAIYTVTERTVTDANGKYRKVYDVKVALYKDGIWKGYGGVITVDNPGGNNANQQIELGRIF